MYEYTRHYLYSFKLHPDITPDIICHNSRIIKKKSKLGFIDKNINDDPFGRINNDPSNTTKVFAQNYNILRIMSGMGGLSYST